MPIITLSHIRRRLRHREPRETPRAAQNGNRAAVALALAGEPDALHLAFIRRTERDDDPWSGQMALPGGRADRDDETALAV